MPTITELELPSLPMEDPAFSEAPLPQFAAAREQHPWLATCAFGFVITQYDAMRDLLWLDHSLTGAYDNVVEAMQARGTQWGRFQQESLLAQKGEPHARIRKVLAPAFTPQQANRHRPLMRETIATLLDEWVPKGAFDFEEFASFFPISVMARLIGAPAEAIPGLRSSMEAFGLSMSMDRPSCRSSSARPKCSTPSARTSSPSGARRGRRAGAATTCSRSCSTRSRAAG